MTSEQKRQIQVIRDAARAIGLVERGKGTSSGVNVQKLWKRSGISVSLLSKYLHPNPERWVKVGEKNAPILANVLGIDVKELQ